MTAAIESKTRSKGALKYELLLLLTSIIWGSTCVAQQIGMEKGLGPMTFNGIRFALGCLSLIPVIIWRAKTVTYALAARVVTVHTNDNLLVTANDAKTPIGIALPYTLGKWQETEPVEIALVKGKNVLRFTRNIPNYGVTIKHFTLTPIRQAQGGPVK